MSPKDITICGHRCGRDLEMVKYPHGYVASGMVLGGFMADLVYKHLPKGEYVDAPRETRARPPACEIQTLTGFQHRYEPFSQAKRIMRVSEGVHRD
jgi:hypothetical protein